MPTEDSICTRLKEVEKQKNWVDKQRSLKKKKAKDVQWDRLIDT